MQTIEKKCELFGKTIHLQLVVTEWGIQALVTGGDRAHIGAVAVIDEKGTLSSVTFPGHKETVIVTKWAENIHRRTKMPVVVSAGIHYDQASRKQIEEILKAVDQLFTLADC